MGRWRGLPFPWAPSSSLAFLLHGSPTKRPPSNHSQTVSVELAAVALQLPVSSSSLLGICTLGMASEEVSLVANP